MYENEITSSSSEKSIGMMKNYFLYLTKDFQSIKKNFEDTIVKDLEYYKISRFKNTSQYMNICNTALCDVEQAYVKLENAKSNSEKIRGYLSEAKLKLSNLESSSPDTTNVSDEPKKEKEQQEKNNLMGRMFGAFHNTPEQDREKYTKKVTKFQHELLAANEEISSRKKELVRKIEIRDDTLDKVI